MFLNCLNDLSFDITSEAQSVEKSYGIDSEIKFTDIDGEIAFSDNMKVNVFLKQSGKKVNITGIALAGLVIMGLVLIIKNKRKNGLKKSSK